MQYRPIILCIAALTTIVGALGITSAASASHSLPQGHKSPLPKTVTHLTHRLNIKVPRTHLPHVKLASGITATTTWSGYLVTAASGQEIKFVKSYFSVPSVNCAKSPIGSSGASYASHWVGLDGLNESTVEQTGVSAYCTSTSGPPHYYAWYEMFPLNPVTFSNINPGDAINAWVYFNGSSYNLNLRDLTTGASISTTQKCPSGYTCLNHEAEVISEDPGNGVASGYDLADFGMANYTNSAVTSLSGAKGTLSGNSGYWSSSEIEMKYNGTVMALPSSLEGGQEFNIAWQAAS